MSDRGWDGWMASLTRWMWVWVNSGSWWWTGRPGVLRFTGSQRVRHDWATELNWTDVWDNLITWPKGYKGMLFWLQFDQREQSLAWKFVITQNWSESHTVMSNSLRPDGLCRPWNSPDQNTGVGSLSLPQGSSQPRDWTQVSRIAGGFFTRWATREAQLLRAPPKLCHHHVAKAWTGNINFLLYLFICRTKVGKGNYEEFWECPSNSTF